jgi:hypothetical protein
MAPRVELSWNMLSMDPMHGPPGRGEAEWRHYLRLHPISNLCENLRGFLVEAVLFYPVWHETAPEIDGETVPNGVYMSFWRSVKSDEASQATDILQYYITTSHECPGPARLFFGIHPLVGLPLLINLYGRLILFKNSFTKVGLVSAIRLSAPHYGKRSSRTVLADEPPQRATLWL